MLKRFFNFSFLLFSVFHCCAQVDLQTGSATFSLPMFNWQDDKSNLNSTVSLNYSSGNGLKVNDVASNVGQGWNLVAGGVITRMQVGEPDDQVASGSSDPADTKKFPAGFLYAANPAYNGCPNALTKYPLYKKQNTAYSQHNIIAEDKQLDYFSFQFNGKAGMFVLDPTDGTHHGRSIGDSKMIITYQEDAALFSQGIRTKITSFWIQDVDGLIYKFTVQGMTKVLELNYCDVGLTQLQHLPKFRNLRVYQQTGFDNLTTPWVIDNWYLSEIFDPLTSRKVKFTYLTRMISPAQGVCNAGADFSYNSVKDYAVVVYKKSFTKSPEIDSIIYPDGHTFKFNYNLTDRFDFTGEQALASVDIKYNGRSLSRYILNTTYIMRSRFGTPSSTAEQRSARLFLRSVQKIGPDLKEDSPPYAFDYYTGSNVGDDFVPPPFFYAKDIWGFYNGSNSVAYDNSAISLDKKVKDLLHIEIKGLCFMNASVSGPYLNPKDGLARNGLMRQIIYPTGGTLTYEYVQNSGTIFGQGSAQMVGGVHVSKTTSTDGGYANGCANAISTQYNYVLSDGTTSSLWGLEMPQNGKWTASHYTPFDQVFRITGCKYKYFYPGIVSAKQTVDIAGLQQFMNAVQPFLGALSVVGTIMDIATLIGSAAPGFGTIAAVVIDLLSYIVGIVSSCSDQSQDPSTTIYYNMDLTAISPLPAQFKRVEIINGSGGAGKTIQTFTNDSTYALWVGPVAATLPVNDTRSFAARQRFAPWAYGLPDTTIILDNTGKKVKQTINVYNFGSSKTLIAQCLAHCGFFGASGLTSPLVSCKCDVTQSHSERSTEWNNEAVGPSYLTVGGPDMKVDYYGLYTGRTELATTYERVYKASDQTQYVETVSNYSYAGNFEMNSISTTGSDGIGRGKLIKYTSDYAGGIITTLLNNNIVSVPVEVSTSVSDASGNGYVLSEEVTEFTQVGNGAIKPSRKLEQRFAQPQPVNNFTYYLGPGSDVSNYKVRQTFTYGPSGNLTTTKDEGNRSVANIYDYNQKYIVATIINADSAADKPAYSSFETDNLDNYLGGWTYTSGTPTYTNTNVVTGSRAINLNTGKTLSRTSLNTTKAYILSFWSNLSMTVSAGATLSKTGPTINGFTYYEYNVAVGTASVTVSCAAARQVDELRLYPANARMRTVTYDPIIGKTSECDENNRITSYEYDNLGRLRFIKDENKNIVKMYEYNNVSAAKQNGCPTTYYNHLIVAYFTKACAAGFAGTDVPVTVAANTFSSMKSQADADAQAENWLLANGQNTANSSGSCLLIYNNTVQSQSFTTQCDSDGYTGNSVTYTVAANTYSSTISQADADQKALDDIDANGQSWANDHGVCSVTTTPDWGFYTASPTVRCQTYGAGINTGNQEAVFTDLNPNSATYNQTQWMYYQRNTTACPYTPVSPPSLPNGVSAQSASGIIPGTPGQVLTITVTLNSSVAGALLTGNVGISVNLSGMGMHSTSGQVTVPASGYISWTLNLSGPASHMYISSSITSQ